MSSSRQHEENRNARDQGRSVRPSLANRDKPVFTTIHKPAHSQDGPPKFFTESLNTSFASRIPSPSPARPTYRGKGRQTFGNNGRGLAAAYHALDSSLDLDKNTGSNGHDTESQSQSNTSSPSQSASKRAQARFSPNVQQRTKTPSPVRGRQEEFPLVSPVSNASESSPPRGLAEAYRRIEDEETLASLGTSDPEEDFDLYHANGQLRSRLSVSPNSRRGSRRFSPRPETLKACEEAATDREPSLDLDRTSRGSSPFINPPDDDMSSQHEKDELRIRSALSNHARPFSKARAGTKKKLTVENLKRADGGSSGSASSGSRSLSSRASDMSLNVPPGWGRKGRTNKVWLNGITEDTTNTEKAQVQDKESSDGQVKNDSIVDWMEAATDTSLPQAKGDSLQDREPPLQLSHSEKNSPLTTGPKLVARAVSTTPSNSPPPRLQNNTIEAIKLREAESQAEVEKENRRPTTTMEDFQEDEEMSLGLRSLSQELQDVDENLEEPDTRANDELEAQTAHVAAKVQTDNIFASVNETPARPVSRDSRHARGDSRDILRSLARVESNSPSPHRSEKSQASQASLNKHEKPVKQDHPSKLTVQSVKEPKLPSPQITTQTPLPDPRKSLMKTPKVTGAWVDTPLPTKTDNDKVALVKSEVEVAKESSTKDWAENTNIDPAIKLEDTAPKLPGSALAGILERAKARKRGEVEEANDDTLQLNDSDVESLEGLVERSDNEGVQSGSEITKASVTEKLLQRVAKDYIDEKDRPMTSDESAELLSKISRLHSSIRDANKDASALEKIIATSKSKISDEDDECVEGGELHDFLIPCETCVLREQLQSTGTGWIEWQVVKFPGPKLWIWRENSRPRLTRLGTCVLFLVVLVVAEVIVADAYTPPFSPSSMAGYEFGVYYDMPRPPFVLAKLAWRNGLSVILQPVWNLFCFFMRALYSLSGAEPGIFGHADDVYDTREWEYKEAWEYSFPSGEPVGMGQDEYL